MGDLGMIHHFSYTAILYGAMEILKNELSIRVTLRIDIVTNV